VFYCAAFQGEIKIHITQQTLSRIASSRSPWANINYTKVVITHPAFINDSSLKFRAVDMPIDTLSSVV